MRLLHSDWDSDVAEGQKSQGGLPESTEQQADKTPTDHILCFEREQKECLMADTLSSQP